MTDGCSTAVYSWWLRNLAKQAEPKGVVDNLDARALARIADRLDSLQREVDISCRSAILNDPLIARQEVS